MSPWYAINENGLSREFGSYEDADAFAWPRIKGGETWSISPTKPATPLNPTPEDFVEASRRFVTGLLDGMGVIRSSYEIGPISGPDVGSYERAAFCTNEIGRIQAEDRRAFLDRCLAALDRSMERIGASDDIRQYLQAAE